MLILIWGFILLLAVAVVFLIWFQFKNQADKTDPSVEQNQLQEKVHHLEENLKDLGNYARSCKKDACATGSDRADHV